MCEKPHSATKLLSFDDSVGMDRPLHRKKKFHGTISTDNFQVIFLAIVVPFQHTKRNLTFLYTATSTNILTALFYPCSKEYVNVANAVESQIETQMRWGNMLIALLVF